MIGLNKFSSSFCFASNADVSASLFELSHLSTYSTFVLMVYFSSAGILSFSFSSSIVCLMLTQ